MIINGIHTKKLNSLLEGGYFVAVVLEPGDQLLDVVRPPELDLDRHLHVPEAGVEHTLTAVLDPDDVDAHLRDGARQALQLPGAVSEPGTEGEVPAGRGHAEADDPEEQQRVDVAAREDDDGRERDRGAPPHGPRHAHGRS